jgi:hypothetical protein
VVAKQLPFSYSEDNREQPRQQVKMTMRNTHVQMSDMKAVQQ